MLTYFYVTFLCNEFHYIFYPCMSVSFRIEREKETNEKFNFTCQSFYFICQICEPDRYSKWCEEGRRVGEQEDLLGQVSQRREKG
jgi:hypothetical protein